MPWSARGLIPEAVVLTHTHFDHAGNTAWLAAEYGAEVVVQEAESLFLAGGDTPIPQGTYAVTKGLVSIGRKVQPVFRYDPCVADHVFADMFDLNRFGINGYVIHTPGHSPGGATVVIDDVIAIAGDSIIGTTPGKPFPPFADDVDLLIRTWKKILDTGCETILPGHGKPVSREEMIIEYNKRKVNMMKRIYFGLAVGFFSMLTVSGSAQDSKGYTQGSFCGQQLHLL